MTNMRWFDPQQPQTLQGAVLFSYLNAGVAILALLSSHSPVELAILAGGVGALGMANERRWGYLTCIIAAAVFSCAQAALFFFYPFYFATILNLGFSIFLLALLLHPVSQRYVKIAFH